MRIVVMGPSGSGKSAVGAALAGRIGAPFVDADDLHPAANVAKMSAGTPLDDADRMPWLDIVARRMAAEASVVMACSALARRYRDRILTGVPDAVFLALEVSPGELARRMASRSHFMPPALLASQLATFEPLAADEPGAVIDADRAFDEVVDAAAVAVQSLR